MTAGRPKRAESSLTVVQAWFTLTVTLTGRDGQTRLAWVQEFESPKAAAKRVDTADEQNLDRLQALLANERSGS